MKSMVQADGSSSKAEALQVRGRTENRNNNYNRDKSKTDGGCSKSKGRGGKFCKYCQKASHNIDDCWKLQNKEKRNGTYQPKNKSEGDGKAAIVSSDNSDGDYLVVFAGCVSSNDEWILDSACSFHICCNKDWFSSYEFVQSEDVVRMGDNNPREITGIGSVQIKMHDGMTRLSTDVRHIPGMARNLISLSTLDVDGYKHSGSHGVLKVSKGYLVHMIGDMNSAKLYVLRGSTLSGIAAAVIPDEPDVTDAVDFSDNSDDEQQRISVQVEHVEEKENDVAENDNTVVQHSPPGLQQTNGFIAADRPRRNKGPRPCLIEECNLVHHALSCAEQVEHDTEPATYTEAVASVDRVKWISAMQEEMQSLDKNGILDVVPFPKQNKVVRCKWIFKTHSSIRALFGIVAMHDLELEQLDVKTAFLHGELEEEIYMDQPEGFVVPGKEVLVCKLKRSLYGLKQSPRQWYKSQSAIYLTKDQMFHERTKHIDIKYHYVHDIVAQGFCDMSSLKFDLPQLDYTMRFSLWQVKMRAILNQSSDLDEALDGFGKKYAKTWIDDEKKKYHTLLYSLDELTLAEFYEALQQREKMKSMVHADGSSSKAEALQVRGRIENRNNNYNRDKSKTDRGRSKSKGRDGKFCKYYVTDAVDFSDNSDDEQQRISVQVEHVEEKENDC
ncbi:hypothetical protein QYE76_056255 [Lolium multiflorum]|uniref:Reverse transcriptase Ty1/copia-type domain-containing protein n=1 Tax=Lolium multiflorum TaxID=4521 RepID=A0AAD8WN13_LOLMU|nr:hypothetical protein QYE76_056255 [Lolium multiflorum]